MYTYTYIHIATDLVGPGEQEPEHVPCRPLQTPAAAAGAPPLPETATWSCVYICMYVSMCNLHKLKL